MVKKIKTLQLTKTHINILLITILLFLLQQVNAISDSKLNDYRIRIHTSTNSVTIKVDNNYSIYVDGKIINYTPATNGENFTFTKQGSKVSISENSGKVLGSGLEVKLMNKASSLKCFEVKGIDGQDYAKYPDNVIVKLNSNMDTILVINSTNLETYLKGVLPHEIGGGAPLEALKAQAITARTLAVMRVGKNSKDGFDITNTTSDQVYKGYTESYFNANSNVSKAVEGTKGKVLLYKGQLLDGIFCSNNGGQTADDSFVWSSGIGKPYYTSKVDPFDKYLNSYTSGWAKLNYTQEYTKEELKKVIMENSVKYPAYFKTPYCTPSFNGISDDFNIEILKESNGYVTELKLWDNKGKEYIFKNYSSRWLLGLRSQQFTLTKDGKVVVKGKNSKKEISAMHAKNVDGTIKGITGNLHLKGRNGLKKINSKKYTFVGKGYGHGVGMSQNGAMNRADSGQTYEQILKFYYEGSTIGSNYGN